MATTTDLRAFHCRILQQFKSKNTHQTSLSLVKLEDVPDTPDLESLPKKRMSAGCLIRDAHGTILVVQPGYKPTLEIPGGITEQNESPKQCARREISEELGLTLEPRRLLVVNYLSPTVDRTESLSFIFDGGILEPDRIAQIRLPPAELEWFRFIAPTELLRLLVQRLARRMSAALEALKMGETWYLEDGIRL